MGDESEGNITDHSWTKVRVIREAYFARDERRIGRVTSSQADMLAS